MKIKLFIDEIKHFYYKILSFVSKQKLKSGKYLVELSFVDTDIQLLDLVNPHDAEYRLWFAWYPIRLTDGSLKWLTSVYKRKYILTNACIKRTRVFIIKEKVTIAFRKYKLVKTMYISKEEALLELMNNERYTGQIYRNIVHSNASNKQHTYHRII